MKNEMKVAALALVVVAALFFMVSMSFAEPDQVVVLEDDDVPSLILFGDLHSHSSNSLDAMALHLPIVGRDEFRTPQMSCEFARYCSQVDFWALTDHAEEQTQKQWQGNLTAQRQCQEKYAADTKHPGPVCFLGWEWTDSHSEAKQDYGHHNIVLKGLSDDDVPPRPFAAPSGFARIKPFKIRIFSYVLTMFDPTHKENYRAVLDRVLARADKPMCEQSDEALNMDPACHEEAANPMALTQKLKDWKADALVIPHGTTWGMQHPKDVKWVLFDWYDYDPDYSPVFELDSGHGNAESYRPWKQVEEDEQGRLRCPYPTKDFEPCCWRAGEIVRQKDRACKKEPKSAACENKVVKARQAYVDAGRFGIKTLPDATAEDWLDCGQCRDCFQPPLDHNPAMSMQAALTIPDLQGPEKPWRYRFGFIGSTDSHRAGPGAGYKEFREQSDGYGPAKEDYSKIVKKTGSMVTPDYGRQNSYFYAGSLAAVHAVNRSRGAIWASLKNRKVYTTSGDRILLWFDMVNEGQPTLSMGSRAKIDFIPTFEVRAIGSFIQEPGCPDWVKDERSEEFLQSVCFGECYNPTNQRYKITRIDVVKILLRESEDESMERLIIDPYKTFQCPMDSRGCKVVFQDPDFVEQGRAAAYYVRAYQEPTPQFNSGNLRCERDANGQCIESHPCDNGVSGAKDDCLTLDSELAWSSPIYLEAVKNR